VTDHKPCKDLLLFGLGLLERGVGMKYSNPQKTGVGREKGIFSRTETLFLILSFGNLCIKQLVTLII
jgi:hypothetical protein